MIIAVDMDGTLAEHEYPEIGPEIPEAFRWLKLYQKHGHQLIFWTMRSDNAKRKTLSEAVDWCRDRGVSFWGVNENPEQRGWTSSPKCYAQVYVDDAAYGCPLVQPVTANSRPYANWRAIGPDLARRLGIKGF
jgi:hypothetical protein